MKKNRYLSKFVFDKKISEVWLMGWTKIIEALFKKGKKQLSQQLLDICLY
jgi:hypothetical protein